jgi:hypothetical protein
MVLKRCLEKRIERFGTNSRQPLPYRIMEGLHAGLHGWLADLERVLLHALRACTKHSNRHRVGSDSEGLAD